MRVALRIRTAATLLAALLLLGVPTLAASAESAYIAQVPAGSGAAISRVQSGGASFASAPASSARPQPLALLHAAVPVTSGTNIAGTLQVGSFNQVAQLQLGHGNASAVGVVGVHNNVGVLQAGNNLRSNLVLLGTQRLNVGVIQPNGSAPVNMLIARLPNGGLLIKR